MSMPAKKPHKKYPVHQNSSPWLWFVGLYLLGITVTVVVAYGGRWLIRL